MKNNLLEKYSVTINEIKQIKGVDSIIIFGSYAKGKIKPLSDLDVCIITGKNISKKVENDILSYGTDELDISLFYKLPLSLQFKIMIEGQIIYSKTDLTNLKIKTINKWYDFKPILNRLYKARGYPAEI